MSASDSIFFTFVFVKETRVWNIMVHLFHIYIYICINLVPLFVARWLIHIYSHARIREENKPELS